MTYYDYPTGFSCWGEEEYEAISRVVKSNWFTMGPEVEAFESEFAAYHGRKHCVMTNSGSSANLIMVAAVANSDDKRYFDTVAVPAIAWSTTYAPFIQHGYRLVLCDVDKSWNAAGCSEKSIHVYLACSILGNPTNYSYIFEAAKKSGAIILEDNCESLGAKAPDGMLTGNAGVMSSASFFYSHQLSAIEGGAVLTDDDDYNILLRKLRAHGWSRDIKSNRTFDEDYEFTLFGYNVRPVEMHAAIAREQLKKLPFFMDRRSQNLGYFRVRVDGEGLPIELQRPNGKQSPFGLCFTVNSKSTRQVLVDALKQNSIDCRLPTGGSFRKHIYGKRWQLSHTPEADRIHDCGLFIGNAPFDISDKIERAIQVMKKVLL